MKTHFKKLRNPNYVGSWDLTDTDGNFIEKVVTITAVKKEMVHDGKGGQEECTIVHLKETKPMVANSTNLRTIARLCQSPYIEDWAGKQIALFVQKVRAFGEVHDAIRIKAASAAKIVKPTLTPERFNDALEAIKNGKITKDYLTKTYTLTNEQLQSIS